MAITIDLKDANNDGTGINFDSYLKTFDKKYVSSGYGGMTNETESGSIPDGDYYIYGDDYVSWDGKKNGQSVIFEGGADGWEYEFSTHTMKGDINAVTFGTQTKENDSSPEYTNNGEIRVSFEEFTTKFSTSDFVESLADGDTKKFLQFLNSDSIVFNGSSGKDTFTSFAKADILHGEAGNDRLNGGKGADQIWGDEGNDVLTGGKGGDTFVFEAGDGKDKITDFAGTDKIDFSGQFADFDAVMDAATASKKGVTIAYDGGSVLLEGLKLANLTENHFVFDI